ncbi:MAG: trypsin-like peptidase domain-containing protein [Planctomycetota bacterium]
MMLRASVAIILMILLSCTSAAQDLPPEMKAMALTAKAFRKAADKIEPSLVSIESFGGVGAKQGRIGGIRKQGEGNTTGVIISEDGYILTSTFNFIQNPPIVTVITNDGKKRTANLLGRDDTRKVCLLKIDGVKDLPVPEMLPVEDVRVGQWSVSIGVGYGDSSPAISMGIISAKNRIGGRALQTDANISPANYGGPLVDIEGRMLGICVPMNPQSQAVGAGVEWYDSGIGFAVPVTDFNQIIDRLKDGSTISPGFMGIQSSPNPNGDGLVVSEIVKESAADEVGLKKGDIVLSFNGEPVSDMLRLRQLVNRFEAGEKVELVFQRGKEDSVKVTLTLGPPPKPKDQKDLPFELPKIR